VLISVQERSSALWGVIKARLDTSYSKIRQNGAPFLAYTIVDACVDDLTPIVHTLGAKLMMLERLLALDPNRFDVSRLHHCSKQIKGLKRLCKPLNEVVIQMSESNDFTGDILRYFRDVQDHIAIVQDDCDKHLDSCKSLVDEVHNIRAGQQNDVSYLLTLVAAIFLPAQFLTGLYGMNFHVMPELEYQYGYLVWWIVTLGLATSTVVYFHMKRWL
jgi:magnesium/cobalt transport protein CorA